MAGDWGSDQGHPPREDGIWTLEDVWEEKWLELKGSTGPVEVEYRLSSLELFPPYKCLQHHPWETALVNLQISHNPLGSGVGSECALDVRVTRAVVVCKKYCSWSALLPLIGFPRETGFSGKRENGTLVISRHL